MFYGKAIYGARFQISARVRYHAELLQARVEARRKDFSFPGLHSRGNLKSSPLTEKVAKYVFGLITKDPQKGLLFLQVKNRILSCSKNCSQVTHPSLHIFFTCVSVFLKKSEQFLSISTTHILLTYVTAFSPHGPVYFWVN